ncbi:MAG: CBS domain-containing protein, partial [bacterium]|nr:CBS domain-containing protein [bacterium]
DYSNFPVLDENDELIGMVDAREVRMTYKEQQLGPFIIAQDFIQAPVTINYSDTLFTAIRRQHEVNMHDLIVVDDDNPKKVMGVLSGNDIVSTYDREIKKSMLDLKHDIKEHSD